MRVIVGTAALGLLLATGTAAQEAADRLYGQVVTRSGDVYEGYIRWDKNEASWTDILDGSKELPDEFAEDARRMGDGEDRDRRRERSIEFLGLRISWDDDDWGDFPRSASSGIRFGHIQRLEAIGDDEAWLTLKNGEELELEGGSTDIGDELRGLEVDDPRRGTIELRWRDLESVEFMAAPADAGEPVAHRLHGTLVDRWGNEYTGYVAWDLDEVFDSDVLDGEDRGRDREIPFRSIAAIERNGSRAARVTLRTGEEIELDGSNDVNDDNRGIQLSDPALGLVQVDWDAFESLRFHAPSRPTGYDAFDGGFRLWGTVRLENGDQHTGWIRWDSDEEWSWELLNGEWRDVVYEVEFGNVRHVERQGSRGATVTLFDGRVLELEDSNDVDRGNKGIVVEDQDGERVLIPWRDVRDVAFERP